MSQKLESLKMFLLLTFIAYIVGGSIVYIFLSKGYFIAVSIGYFLSVVNIISGYLSIKWAFRRDNKTFYLTVFGGLGIRLLLFVFALFFMFYFSTLPILGFVLSFIIFYILMQFNEIRLINQELKSVKK